ncbi:TetR/AcrR family transcriptional regulator [Amycolatopsis sp. H20-H5]|uniref:TetR/AcrR family transcriptional regulator n=1 Tax=Amycolatopsis sp. H20-H5 TaxID=3046309 RepID=UPI002DB8542E|nr:TetR/AcrR family transcriptional regulator [Amycolatopsis sp. H20-H5]MEC3975374.1 TetR/AcrR family transcriptional regulator [Amycolatopsis sp. H20-H5]
MPSKYHHGELRTVLVSTSLDLIAEQGLKGFSVAEVARRAAVSPAAPYRHFPDRESLLAAVACRVALQLAEHVEASTAAQDDPAGKLAAAAGAYTAYVMDRRAGLHVVFAAGLDNPKYVELHEHSRKLMDHFLVLAFAVAPDPQTALELMEQLLAQAHGYATFQLDGVFAQHGYSTELVVRKSVESARIVIRGHLAPSGP